jgi:hypothetical protein
VVHDESITGRIVFKRLSRVQPSVANCCVPNPPSRRYTPHAMVDLGVFGETRIDEGGVTGDDWCGWKHGG